MLLRPQSRHARRAGFSIAEILVCVVMMMTIAMMGAMNSSAAATRFKQQAEAERLVSCLRWLREMARERGRYWQTGYGVYFWRNPVSGTCFEYSPYTLRTGTANVPDHPANAITAFPDMGLPSSPIRMAARTENEAQTLTGAALTAGLWICFQSDTSPKPADRFPNASRNQPGAPIGETLGPPSFLYRVIFWPPGNFAGLNAAWQHSVTLPQTAGAAPIVYNRIYVADRPVPGPAALPQRIHIDPGTGLVRLMGQDERRIDGSW
jgi:type II secretory pathway pseudopilin PulG